MQESQAARCWISSHDLGFGCTRLRITEKGERSVRPIRGQCDEAEGKGGQGMVRKAVRKGLAEQQRNREGDAMVMSEGREGGTGEGQGDTGENRRGRQEYRTPGLSNPQPAAVIRGPGQPAQRIESKSLTKVECRMSPFPSRVQRRKENKTLVSRVQCSADDFGVRTGQLTRRSTRGRRWGRATRGETRAFKLAPILVPPPGPLPGPSPGLQTTAAQHAREGEREGRFGSSRALEPAGRSGTSSSHPR